MTPSFLRNQRPAERFPRSYEGELRRQVIRGPWGYPRRPGWFERLMMRLIAWVR